MISIEQLPDRPQMSAIFYKDFLERTIEANMILLGLYDKLLVFITYYSLVFA